MAEEKENFIENPQVDESVPKTTQEDTEPIDVDQMIQTLEKFNVKPDQLQGKLQNAKDYSQIRSERDTLANEIANIRQEMAQMNRSTRQTPNDDFDYREPDETRAVDIESALESAVDRVLTKREQAALAQQQRENELYMKITQHKNYHLVKDKFEDALRDPNTVMAMRSGKIDPFEFYSDMVIGEYANIAQKSLEGFKKMRGNSSVSAPHVESGARVPSASSTPKDKTEQQKKARELINKAKNNKPISDQEMEDAIGMFLGDL